VIFSAVAIIHRLYNPCYERDIWRRNTDHAASQTVTSQLQRLTLLFPFTTGKAVEANTDMYKQKTILLPKTRHGKG